MKRSVLVTGGAGYIGSHLCKRLAAEGWEPVVLDDLSIGNAWAVKWGPLIEADLLDDTALAAVFEEYRPAAVMHLAALSSVAESMRAPERYREVNVTGTAKLVAAMRRAGVPHLVFSSSASVYGLPERSPIGEDHPLRPINVYGETKLEAEQLLAGPALAEGVAAVSLRYFNAAGADPAGEIGERRREESHLIPLAMEVAAGRRPVLELHGWGELQDELIALNRKHDTTAMAELITDEMVETIALTGSPIEVVDKMRARLGDVIHRTSFSGVALSDQTVATMLARLRD